MSAPDRLDSLLMHLPHLLLLGGDLGHSARLGVRAAVLLALELTLRDGLLDLCRLQDCVGHVLMVLDALDLRQVLVLLHECRRILSLQLLPAGLGRAALIGHRTPNAHVGVVRAGEDVRGIHRPADGEEALHALRVVDLLRLELPRRPDAQRLVVAAADELAAGGAVVDGEHRRDVVAVHAQGVVKLAHVESVQAVVLGREGEVHRLHRVPAQRVRPRLHGHLAHRRARAHVVQRDRAVGGDAAEQVVLRGVEAQPRDRVGAPLEGVQRLGARRVPQQQRRPRRAEGVLLVVVVDVVEAMLPQVLRERRGVVALRRGAPQLHRLVVGRGDEVVPAAGEGHAADEAGVRARRPEEAALGQVPPADLAVAAAGEEGGEGAHALRHAVHAVHVPAQRADKRLGEVAVELDRVDGALVLARLLEGVELGLRRPADAREL
mmetsp:Transcript_32734/g.81490  ORF Transcript_32734/g.81490 Transcript_32734/m.81490 type:complete len:435 (+) Transcript_32734:247-1551(+)